MARFAALGLDHRHIYDLTAGLIAAGATCVGHDTATSDPRVLAGFRRRFPDISALDRGVLLADPSVDFVVIAAIPRDRAALAIAAMRAGKHVLTDKPGVTTDAQLEAVRAEVMLGGRRWSIALGRLLSPSAQAMARMIAEGRIGRLVHLTQLLPHRLNRALRPGWFFDPAAYGGIIADIGVHAVDQFLACAGADTAVIDHCGIRARGTAPEGFQDVADFTLRAPGLSGYTRLDWFTPDGLADWGDGRVFAVGTEGTIELRKNLDLAGRAGGHHMFVTDRSSTEYYDCAGEPVTYYRDFLSDIADGGERSMAQAQVFAVCRLALALQRRGMAREWT